MKTMIMANEFHKTNVEAYANMPGFVCPNYNDVDFGTIAGYKEYSFARLQKGDIGV